MTIEMQAEAETFRCTGKRHTPSNQSWRLGCRHPGAVAAHEKWLATRNPYTKQPPAVDADGNCVAIKHGTWQAFVAGCRHEAAIAADRRHRKRKQDECKLRRDREFARQFSAESRRIQRRTGGRLLTDPRKPWRGGRMAVGRWPLFWITRGMFMKEATQGEMMVAVIRLEKVLVPDSPWHSRPLTGIEIGERLSMNDREVYRMRRLRNRLRGERTQRRLADSRWRAAVVAAAVERGRGN